MLKKLLKYDLLNVYKLLSVFYILTIFFAILTRLFFKFDNSTILNIIAYICSGTTISMMANILINNITRVGVRFKQNLYGDESYLTHTLPVTKNEIYLSKFLTALITIFTSTIIIFLSIFIAYYSKSNIEILKNLLFPLTNLYDISFMKFLFATIFVVFLELLVLLQSIYQGIILGHKKNDKKIAFSFLYIFIVYMLNQVFVLSILFITGIFNKDIMSLFLTNNINFDLMKKVMLITTITYIVNLFINYFISLEIFNEGVNVD